MKTTWDTTNVETCTGKVRVHLSGLSERPGHGRLYVRITCQRTSLLVVDIVRATLSGDVWNRSRCYVSKANKRGWREWKGHVDEAQGDARTRNTTGSSFQTFQTILNTSGQLGAKK